MTQSGYRPMRAHCDAANGCEDKVNAAMREGVFNLRHRQKPPMVLKESYCLTLFDDQLALPGQSARRRTSGLRSARVG